MRCRDTWRRSGATTVGVKATCADSSVFYELSYEYLRNDPDLPILHGETFPSNELRKGVSWHVPEGYRTVFQLRTTSNKAIDTEIELDGEVAECHPGRHCQGVCAPSGAAGIAGDWSVTAAKTPGGGA